MLVKHEISANRVENCKTHQYGLTIIYPSPARHYRQTAFIHSLSIGHAQLSHPLILYSKALTKNTIKAIEENYLS